MNGVVAHFVCKQSVNRVALLALSEMGPSHDGASICENVLEVLRSYDLSPEKIGIFMLDNATSNDVAVLELSKVFAGSFAETPKFKRLRCMGHILNLVAQDCMGGKDFEAFENDLRLKTTNMLKETESWRNSGPIGLLFFKY